MVYLSPANASRIFPIAKHYGITCIEEARAFFDDEVLGARLREITGALLSLETNDAVAVFGELDAKKIRSSMTLFREAAPECDLFGRVLDKFFDSTPDQLTVKLLG